MRVSCKVFGEKATHLERRAGNKMIARRDNYQKKANSRSYEPDANSRPFLRIALPVCYSSYQERIGCRGSGTTDFLHTDPTPTSNSRAIENQVLVVYHATSELPEGSSPPHKTSRSGVPTRCPRFADRGSQPLEYLRCADRPQGAFAS